MPQKNKNALTHLQKDPILAQIIAQYGALDPVVHHHDDLFTNLIDMIVSQQLSGKVAVVIFGRLKALIPSYPFLPADVIEAEQEAMRACGLSYAKIRYSKNIAQAVIDNTLNFGYLQSVGDEVVIENLTKIKGIGSWTAEMFLMFSLDRPDVFSTGDLGLKTAISRLYAVDRTDLAKIEAISTRWSPYRTLACRYLWKSLDNQ